MSSRPGRAFALLALLSIPAAGQETSTLPLAYDHLRLTVAASKIKRFVDPRHDLGCTLTGVLRLMELAPRPDVPLPALLLQHKTPLKRFQDAIEPQWKMRPDVFANAYAAAKNEIYVLTEAEYYTRLSRHLDDSIAHELVHYVQVRYKGIAIEDFDESLESEAVHVQTQFRERYLRAGVSPCAP